MAEFVPKFNLKSVKNDRDLRKIRLKLDCPSEIEWDRWKPGREHQKTFHVKNILNKVQTLRWEEPESPYFRTNFQEPHARLNPMMTAAIIIFFHPESVEEYFGTIPFRTARGSFTLHLRGLLPSVNLGLPVHVDYKYCAVKDVTTKTFDIHNDQNFIVGFKWLSVTHPFSITPLQGNLKPGQTTTISCHFCPDDATAYKGVANVGTTTKTRGQVKLFGIGKYTFLVLSRPVVEFGDVLNRTSSELEQIVTNVSPVTAVFTVQRVDGWYNGHDSVFTINPMKGAIPPNSFLSIKVLYHPVVAGTFSYEQFEIFTSQARRASFACSGTAARPVIKFSVPFLDFGSVESGSFSHRTITLENNSSAPVSFQFVTDEVRVFEMTVPRAICNGNRSILLHCNFRPIETMNYYKRVVVILQDQYPMFVDLLGTCYKVALRSATILPYHIYEHRENLKLIIAERELATMVQTEIPELAPFKDEEDEGPMYFDPKDIFYGNPTDDTQDPLPEWSWLETSTEQHFKVQGSGMQSPGKSSGTLANMLLTAEPEEGLVFPRPHDWDLQVDDGTEGLVMHHRQEATGRISAFEVWEEYFMGRMVDWDPVTVDKTYLDFGFCGANVETPVQIVYVKNNLADAVNVHWMAPWEFEHPHVGLNRARLVASRLPVLKSAKPEPEPEPGMLRTVYHIDPVRVKIPAGSSVPFSITFKPLQVDMYYLQLLSCFASTKTSYHVVPNWSTAVQVSGHSFKDRTHMFLPLASLSTQKVVFPPAAKGTSVFQSIMIFNHDANTPLRYHFKSEHLPGEFKMKPSHGLIPPKDFNLITFRFDAGEPKVCVGRAVVTLNDSPSDTMQVNLTATSHIVKVRLERMDQAVCFKPTCVGTQAKLSVTLINISAIPANFEWQLPEKLTKVFCIEPLYGLLKAGERIAIEMSFFPMKEKLYYCKVPCLYAACLEKAFVQDNTHLIEGVTSSDIDKFLLVINGAGISQSIGISPEHLDYGTVVTGFPYKQKMVLSNPSVGAMRFLVQLTPGPTVKHDSFHITFDCRRGVIGGGLTKTILVTVHPVKAQKYDFTITCKTFLPPLGLTFEEDTFQKIREMGGHETRCDKSDAAVESMATCTIGLNAIHPTITITSARVHGMSAQQFFRNCLIRHWNSELEEGKIALRPNGRVIYQELFCLGAPVEDSSQDFPLDFGVRQVGSRSSHIYLVFKSGTPLAVSWRFRLWNDTDIDLENWVMEGQATTHEEVLLRQRPLFQVEPRSGHVEPGETAFVKFSYKHDLEGMHTFPIILQITDGRSVHIYLKGRTVPNPPRVLLYQPDTQYLKSMVVGEVNPPIQTTQLVNNCAVDVHYKVDMAPLVQMQRDNHGFQVLWCPNPTGVIPPMQSVLVHWLFQPLEPKTYTVEIPLHVEDGEGGVLILEARGRLPTEPYDPDSMDGGPPRLPGLTYAWPGVPAVLSSELLDFGMVDELSVTRRLVSVQNLLPKTPIAYWWKNSVGADKMINGQFSVEPQRGILYAGQHVLCKIIFVAGAQPQLFETTLHCEISILLEDPVHSWDISHSSSDTSSEIIVDTWPKELGTTGWNKDFLHKSALTLSTVSSRSKVTDFAMKKSSENTYLHFFERMDHVEAHTPPASNFVLYMTVIGHIQVKDYHPTTEDILSTEDRLPWKPQERSEIEVQVEFVNGILLEILQESLHDEIHNPSFDNLDDNRILKFEEFQQEFPKPLTEDEKFAKLFESLGDGELPPRPPQLPLQIDPDEPRPSLAAQEQSRGLISVSKPLDPRVPRPSALVRAVGKSTPHNEEEPGPKPPEPDYSSLALVAETAEELLEDALFSLTSELFEAN